MKTKSLLIGLLACVLLTFMYNYRAKADASPTPVGFMVPQLVYVCYLSDDEGASYSIATVTRYVKGLAPAPNDNKTITFNGKVATLQMACADPATTDMNDTTVWMVVNYQGGGCELLEALPDQEWTVKKTYDQNNTIAGISLSTDGKVGWVAVNSPSGAQIERWQLADSSTLTIPVNLKDKDGKDVIHLGSITKMAANIVGGEDKIWCMFEDKDNKDEEIVYERIGNKRYFSFLMKRPIGAWNMSGNGSACSIPQAFSHFKDKEEWIQPKVELFKQPGSAGTTWHLDIPEVKTELGVSLGNRTITYIDREGNLIVALDSSNSANHESISINLPDLPGFQPRYVAATRNEIGYDTDKK